ncbi:MAG: 4-(cytidine 5'-diphospho)-2-C-methyl-D-erythritol kinase [Gemmatimonadota bacterium]|nr:4-(cytidine 5'-diphospho)-2-C-methyl-D-erythritol kinase [Gemmatimonadota bacterium]
MNPAVSRAAPAKVNLFLRILAREADGYHSLETLFARVSLADTVTAERREAPGVSLEVEGADTGPADQNLAVRAARMVLDATGNRCGIHLHLLKRIPIGAGLGGGSSNAAATLLLTSELTGGVVPRHELFQFASRLGADVPFLLSGAALALGWGHGERLLRLPALPPAPALLLMPPIQVATPEAYGWLDQARQGIGRRGAVALELASLASWGDVARMAGNDFESPVFGRHPEIRGSFEALAGTHPLLCRMSGSGSALVAVYRTPADRADAHSMLGKKWGRVVAVETG